MSSRRIQPREPGAATRKPLSRVQSVDQYRILQGPKIRQYFSTGDPVRDREAGGKLFRLILILGALGMTLLLVISIIKRVG